MTVLFADLVGFTTLSERLDPETVRRLVDAAFERLVADVAAFGGRVDKIVGDAIVALFGAPIAHEDDAERAVRAGLRMQETLSGYAAESGVAVRMRVGVNTGEVLVGALRAGGDYTAMGDVVNTASRLQTSAEPGEVLVGESTWQITSDAFGYEPRGALFARGRQQPINVWVATEALRRPGHRRGRDGSPLVGRDVELAALGQTIEVSRRRGRGLVMVLLGEAGVGKTRLANELCTQVAATRPDAVVLVGRCLPYGESNPWWPIAECIRSGIGIDEDAPLDIVREKVAAATAVVIADGSEATRVTNGLLHMLGFEGPLRGLQPANARAEATDALRTFMEASVRDHPVVIRLADLHWADDLVLELVDSLADHLARSSFVLVATARRSLMRRWSPRGGRYNLSLVNLDPLDRAAADALLTALAPDASAQLRADLLERSGGNPLYLEELVTLIDEGVSGSELPDTLRGLIAARIDGLTIDEQLTLEDAAVWGSTGHVAVLVRLAEHAKRTADAAAVTAALGGKEIFELSDQHWSFRSDLVREVAYQRLTKLDRLRRHAGIAEYLDASLGSRFADDAAVDAVARHYLEAARLLRELGPTSGVSDDVVERANTWVAEAIRRAEQAAAWVAMARLVTHALDLQGVDGPERLRLLLSRAHARLELWDLPDAAADASTALELATHHRDVADQSRAQMLLGEIASREARPDDAARHLGSAVDGFDLLGDVHGRAEARRRVGMNLFFAGRPDDAAAEIARSLADFEAEGDRRGQAWCLQNLAWVAFATGDVSSAEVHLDGARLAFEAIGDAAGEAWADGLMAFVRFHQGDAATARRLSSSVLRQSERRGDRWGQSMMLMLRAVMDLWDGRSRRALGLAERAITLLRSLGDFGGIEQAHVVAGRASLMCGEVAEGLELLAEARRAGERPLSIGAIGEVAGMVHLGLLVEPARIEEMERALDEGRTGSEVGDAWAAVAMARLGHGEWERAGDVLDRGARVDADRSRPSRRCVEALVATIRGDDAMAAAACADVLVDPRATYLDRLCARLAVGVGGNDPVALDDAASDVAATDDHVSAAIVELARAASGDRSAGTGSIPAWEQLGVDPLAWTRLVARLSETGLDRG